jgi:hypothetical protein
MSPAAPKDDFVVATTDLYLPGSATVQYRAGDLVPADNVEHNGWSDGVARRGTKAADEATPPPAS